MKSQTLFAVFICFALSGCIVESTKYSAIKNQFYSNKLPTVNIQLDSDFTFFEVTCKKGWTMEQNTNDSIISTDLKGFLFKDVQGLRHIRMVVVNTRVLNLVRTHYYEPDFSQDIEPLNIGKRMLGHNSYHTAIILRLSHIRGEVLEKHYGRLLSGGTYFYITYEEKLSAQDAVLSDQQIVEFSKRADSSFMFLPIENSQKNGTLPATFDVGKGKELCQNASLAPYEKFGLVHEAQREWN